VCDDDIDVEVGVLAARCADAGCHASTEPAAGLDLETPGAGERIAGAASATCPPRLLADPADPGASFLLDKLDPDPSCGASMPLGQTALTAEERACVHDWIRALDPGVGPEGGN
jgi:hypothetical protein